MADIQQLERALVKADAAGDADAARAFASEIRKMRTAPQATPTPAQPENTFLGDVAQNAANLGAGLVRGAGSIGATLAYPIDKARDIVQGDRKGKLSRNEERRADMDWALADMGADTDSLNYAGGKIIGEVAGTAGAGGVVGNGLMRAAPALAKVGMSAPTVNNLASALATNGMRAGAATGKLGMATRIAGGAGAGAAGMAMIDPSQAGTGALVGAALPPALAGVGKVGRAIGAKLAGPAVAPELRAAVESARASGYVIPPTQARPTLVNRALEGFAGKLTTAQNASARNQPVTNELARKAIGAADLSEAGIAQVRQQANKAYDALGQVGKFRADAGFAQALDNAGATTAAMRANFPELVNSQVDDLINGLKSRPEFEAQPMIEAIKQFRANASTNKIAMDPAQKALGRAQAKIAGALEDLVERNLQASGNKPLLEAYRGARQTLAKTYDVEKALNKVTGNVDAKVLARTMQKGKPMTGDLRTIAEFAARFKDSTKTIDQMGSLPGLSPLDFSTATAVSGLTANPMFMASVIGRPMARAAVLSGPIQNRLAQAPTPGAINKLLGNEKVNQLAYRSAPSVVSGRR